MRLFQTHSMASQDWRPIDTVPRDGTMVEIMHPEVGRFAMRWNAAGYNPLVSKGVGIWEDTDGQLTWCEDMGYGPSHWRPLEE